MNHPITPQHPAVVLRSHYVHLRSLLAVAMIAVVGLAAAVVILAIDGERLTSASPALPAAAPVPAPAPVAPGVRYDGGPEEGFRGPRATTPASGVRYDGGPEEGSRGPRATTPASGLRHDGGPDEGTRGPGR
jgi:hypothetical protein